MADDFAPLTLGTAGHVDHGKTALVEALTGTNTDRLAEERHRGLTIELGFAELDLPGGRSLSVVDVPGHQRFVRTMVAGATGIDLYLLCVAADDGVMPQTREHRTVLRALGVEHGLVALTKCDLSEARQLETVRAGVAALVPGAPIVQVSARTGEGFDELRGTIAAVAKRAERDRRSDPWPYTDIVLHVDRVFSLRGIGTVVTGTLWSGAVAPGDRVELLPSGKTARVRSVHVHDRVRERAEAVQRVALNLAGVKRSEIARGAVVAGLGSNLRPAYRLDVQVRLEPWAQPVAGARVQIHHGTRDAPARVAVLDREASLVQLRLEAPLIARAGDIVVMRQISPPDTVGGARVLDPHPARHGPGRAAEHLRLIAEGEPEALLDRTLKESPSASLPADPSEWGTTALLGPALHRFSRRRWVEAASALAANGRVRMHEGQLLASLTERKTVAKAEPRPARAPLSSRAREVLSLLVRQGAQPPAPQTIADALGLGREDVIDALEELDRAGDAIRVKPGVYFPSTELARLCEQAVDRICHRGSISIGELRDMLGTSRKYAQALLEHLDAEHRTIRHGDRHVLRRFGSAGSNSGGDSLAVGRQESGGSPGLQSQ